MLMLKFYLFLALLLAATLGLRAQAIGLDQLIYLRGRDVDASNSYLSTRGWVFHDAAEESTDQYGNSTWAHTKQLYSGRAKSFFKLLTADGYYNQACYQTVSKVSFDAIRSKILAYKMVKVSAVAKDGYITTTYLGSNYQVETRLSTDSDTSIPIYSVILAKRLPMGFLPAGKTTAPAQHNEAEAEAETEVEASSETSDAQPQPTQSSEEVLSSSQIQDYKQLISGKYVAPPPVSDFM